MFTLARDKLLAKMAAVRVSNRHSGDAAIAPAVERTLGKGEVACSNHAGSTIFLTFQVIEKTL